jgi:hypothetical protein
MFEYLKIFVGTIAVKGWRILSCPVEIAAFTLGLAIVAFTEIGRIVIAPTRFVVRDFSFEKLGDDLQRCKILLKQSRLVGGYTGRIPSFLPALFMTSLLVGIPTVAVAAKAAWLLHFTPFDGFTRRIPLLTPYIGTASAALHTIFYTAIAAKLAKLPALIVATCCPQFEESCIHKYINAHLIHFFKWVGRKAAQFTMRRLRWAREVVAKFGAGLNRLHPVVAATGMASDLAGRFAQAFSALAFLLPSAPRLSSWRATRVKPAALVPESATARELPWKIETRTVVHTVLTYGLTAFLPYLTYAVALAGYGIGKAAVLSLASLTGIHGPDDLLTATYITLGLIVGAAAGAFVALGSIYGVASLAYRLFDHAARGACGLSEKAEAAIAQSMHEALLLSLIPAFAMVEGLISWPVAAAVTAATAAAAAWFDGWQTIHRKYALINEQKIAAVAP